MRYRIYSDIDWLTDVLVLHERKIAHWFDKVSANLQDHDRRDIHSATQWEHGENSTSVAGMLFCTKICYSLRVVDKHKS